MVCIAFPSLTYGIDVARYEHLGLAFATRPRKNIEPKRVLGNNLLLDVVTLRGKAVG